MAGWDGWRHCMSSTFGAWLPGEARGFRTRHHREHVDGDYKKPPPAGLYARRYAASKARMSRPVVVQAPALRPLVLAEVLNALLRHEVEVIAMCVGATHIHVLGRFPLRRRKPTFDEHGLRTSAIDDPVRHIIGLAKQWSSKQLMHVMLINAPIWAKRGKIVQVRDRAHQVNTFHYIRAHVQEGAAVWCFRDSIPSPIVLPRDSNTQQ